MNYDDFITALTVWREARGTSPEARAGVLAVIRNRVKSRKLPACEIATQKFQFSCYLPGDPNATKFPLPSGREGWQAWNEICALVMDPFGLPTDPTNGATHYFSPMPKLPLWADPAKFTVQIGPFRFYKLEG
jgi:spore germination cell wall hydrolase CwlJ-like protein